MNSSNIAVLQQKKRIPNPPHNAGNVKLNHDPVKPYIRFFDQPRSQHQSGQPPQRVALSQSMLYAYAAMKGNYDRAYPHSSDPLHTSVYLHPCSTVDPRFERPFNLLHWQLNNDPFMFNEAPKGAIWFQDVSCSVHPNATLLQQPARYDSLGLKTFSYKEHKRRCLHRFQSSHYKGVDGYGNYGYIHLNGYWIDPESKKEVFEAENNLLDACHVPKLPIGIDALPVLTEDQMYAAFVEEVSTGPDGDQEGDPRSMYITPLIFARWSVGASLGDHYVAGKAEASETIPNKLRPCKRLPKPVITSLPQFDECDGSAFSGEYTLESSPSVALSARGVDMSAQPTNFSYMHPEMLIELDRAAYGDPNATLRVESWLSSSVDTAPLTSFKEQDIVNALAGSHHLSTGVKKWNEYTSCIDILVKEHKEILTRTAQKHLRRTSLLNDRSQLYQEAYFLEKKIQKRESNMGSAPPTPRRSVANIINQPSPLKKPFQPDLRQQITEVRQDRYSKRSFYQGGKVSLRQPQSAGGRTQHKEPEVSAEVSRSHFKEPSIRMSERDDVVAISQISPNAQNNHKRRRYKGRIERYFAEQEERQIININKTKAMNQNVEGELKELVAAVQDLTAVHKDLCDDLGIHDVREIPGLIPIRRQKLRAFDAPFKKFVPDCGEGEQRISGIRPK